MRKIFFKHGRIFLPQSTIFRLNPIINIWNYQNIYTNDGSQIPGPCARIVSCGSFYPGLQNFFQLRTFYLLDPWVVFCYFFSTSLFLKNLECPRKCLSHYNSSGIVQHENRWYSTQDLLNHTVCGARIFNPYFMPGFQSF